MIRESEVDRLLAAMPFATTQLVFGVRVTKQARRAPMSRAKGEMAKYHLQGGDKPVPRSEAIKFIQKYGAEDAEEDAPDEEERHKAHPAIVAAWEEIRARRAVEGEDGSGRTLPTG